MSTTVTYKGNTLATVSNNTKTLKTAGKYMEDDVTLVDVSSTGGYVTQDQDGFIVLPSTGGGSTPSGLVYEAGTWTPTTDITQPTISFANVHSTKPIYVLIGDASDTAVPYNTIMFGAIINTYDAIGAVTPDDTNHYYGRYQYFYSNSGGSAAAGGWNIYALTGSDTSALSYFLSESSFSPTAGSNRYFRSTRTYKWIAVWAPTT